MSNALIKDAPQLIVISPAVPRVPAVAGSPAYDEVVTSSTFVPSPLIVGWAAETTNVDLQAGVHTPGIYFHAGPTMPPAPLAVGGGIVVLSWYPIQDGHWVTSYTTVHHPAVPGTPAVAAIPAVTRIITNIGWNSGADSVDFLTGGGLYQFSIPIDVIGVVTGFNNVNTGAGYLEIDHGLYFTSGGVRVVERGVQRTAHAAYAGTDVFTIARVGQLVRYFKNSTLLYTSLVASVGNVFADASLYFSGDRINNAVLTSTLSGVFADLPGTVEIALDDITVLASDYDVDQGIVRAALGELGVDAIDAGGDGSAAHPFTGSVSLDLGDFGGGGLGVSAVALGHIPGVGEIGVGNVRLDDITVVASGGLFAPLYAMVALELDEITVAASDVVASGVPGGAVVTGNVHASIDTITVFAASDSHFGVVRMDLGDIGAFSFDATQQTSTLSFVYAVPSGPPLATIFGEAGHGSGFARVVAHPAAPSVRALSAGIVHATPAGPSASVTGTVAHLAKVRASPSAPHALVAGTAAHMAHVRCEPAPPLASAGATAALFAYVAARPAGISATITGTAVTQSHVVAEPAGPSVNAHGGAVVRCYPPSNQQAMVSAVTGRLAFVSARPAAPSALVVGTTGVVGFVYCLPAAPYILPLSLVIARPSEPSVFARSPLPVSAYEGYSITLLASDAGLETLTTHLTVFPFDHLVRWGSTYYGINATGIYELAGDTYDAAPIVATGKTAFDDLETQALKRPRAARVTGEVDDDFAVALVTSRTAQTEYQPCFDGDGLRTHRAKLERGYRLSHVAYAFTNAEGKFFRLNTFAPENDVQKRTQGE